MASTPPTQLSDAEQLESLIEAGGLWRLAPDWLPRDGYAEPTRPVMSRVEAGLRRLVPDE